MKKAIYLLMLGVGVMFASCEKDEIGGTATEALADSGCRGRCRKCGFKRPVWPGCDIGTYL